MTMKIESPVTSLSFLVSKGKREARGLSCRRISPGIYRFRAAGTVSIRRSSTVMVQLCDSTASEKVLGVVRVCREHGHTFNCPPSVGDDDGTSRCVLVDKQVLTARWCSFARMRADDSFDVCLLARPKARTLAGARRPPTPRDGYFAVMVLGT